MLVVAGADLPGIYIHCCPEDISHQTGREEKGVGLLYEEKANKMPIHGLKIAEKKKAMLCPYQEIETFSKTRLIQKQLCIIKKENQRKSKWTP